MLKNVEQVNRAVLNIISPRASFLGSNWHPRQRTFSLYLLASWLGIQNPEFYSRKRPVSN